MFFPTDVFVVSISLILHAIISINILSEFFYGNKKRYLNALEMQLRHTDQVTAFPCHFLIQLDISFAGYNICISGLE